MKRFLMLFILSVFAFGCSSRPVPVPDPVPIPIPDPEPTPTPEPEPEPDPIVKITWDQDGDAACVDHWLIKTSTQNDLSLEDQWIEVGTTNHLPTEDDPYIVPEQSKPYFLAVYAVCMNGKTSEPSDVLEVE